MAASMTYDSLVEDIKSYVERDDEPFVSQIPRFIMMAENKLATRCRGLGILRLVNGAFTASNPTLEKPMRWRETGSFSYVNGLGARTFLKLRSYEYCRVYSDDAGVSDPVYYADYGYEHYFLAGTPPAAYNFELMYFERPEPLDADNQTNWTTQYAPQLILFATLLEAQTWLKLPERAKEFKDNFDDAMAAVTAEADRRIADMSATRRPT